MDAKHTDASMRCSAGRVVAANAFEPSAAKRPDGCHRAGSPTSPPGGSVDMGAGAPLTSRGVEALAAVGGVAVANSYYVQPILAQVGTSLGLAPDRIGLVPALFQLGIAFGLITILPLADVRGTRAVLLAAMPLQAAALLLVALSSGPAVLLPACFAVGVLGVAPYALPPYVSLRMPAQEVGRAMGRITRGLICGILLARLAAGLIAERVGWRAVYAVAATATALAALVAARVLDDPATRDRMGYLRLLSSLAAIARDHPTLRVAAACQFLGFGAFNAFWLSSTLLLHGRFGWSPGAIGAVGLLGAISAALAPALGGLGHKIGPERLRRVALAAALLAWAALSCVGRSLVGLAAGLVVLDVALTVADIASRTILFSAAPERRSRLNALYAIAMFAGGALASVLVGPAWSFGGWSGTCTLGAAATALALGAALIGPPKKGEPGGRIKA